MKKNYHLVALAAFALAVAPVAWAEDIKVDEGGPETAGPQLGPNCDLTGYKTEVQSFSTPVSIPDNNATGVTIGPITVVADGTKFTDVIVGLNMNHTWIGDLHAIVGYDLGCDGSIDAQEVLLCRPGRVGATNCSALGGGTEGFGCSSNLVAANTYNFSSDATVSFPVAGCVSTTNIAGGCYNPTGVTADGNMDAFDQLQKGGCFYMAIRDMGAGDLGTITGWQVHTLNERPVPAVSSTWTAIKALHN